MAVEACGKLHQFGQITFGMTNGATSSQQTIDHIIQETRLMDKCDYAVSLPHLNTQQRNLTKM